MRQKQMRKSLCRQAGKELRRLERQIREKETGGACVRNRTDREQIWFYSGILNYLKNDEEPKLIHRPDTDDRGEITFVYAVFRLCNGGYGFEVSSKTNMDAFVEKYSRASGSRFSPWNTNWEEMAKKTVIKRMLKYAPVSVEFQRALSADETIKSEICVDMTEIRNEYVAEDAGENPETAAKRG